MSANTEAIKTTEINETTCQICGRPIKANNKQGMIAHHGYTRPGNGWQTASCMGARHLPYEVSCDIIPAAVENVSAFIAHTETWLENFANPPAVLLFEKRTGSSWNPKYELTEIQRPESFDPSNCEGRFDRYSMEYRRLKREAEHKIEYAKIDLEYLQKRLADWKAPAIGTNVKCEEIVCQ